MKIVTGDTITNDVQELDVKRVRFVTDIGRTAFEVSIGEDGRSLEVWGVDNFDSDGVLYGHAIQIEPNASNSVTIRTPRIKKYGE